jgi:PAS domain S-box-containing protein
MKPTQTPSDSGVQRGVNESMLAQCAAEPIRTPGTIQPHGVLLGIDPRDQTIVLFSRNAEAFFRAKSGDLRGTPLHRWIEFEAGDEPAIADESLTRYSNPMRVRVLRRGSDVPSERFDAIAHRNRELLILELEAPGPGTEGPTLRDAASDPVFELIRQATHRIGSLTSLEEASNFLADSLRQFTGFDRVMVYRFADQGHGQVIGESKADELEPYLGLRYPASDIPAQARELYKTQLLRLVVDVEASPVPVEPDRHPKTGEALDMSRCVLRSVSPIHLQYLRNMGVRSTMTISLLHDGELWGLLACHHQTPRFVSYAMRTACELLGSVVAPRLADEVSRHHRESTVRRKDMLLPLLKKINGSESIADGVCEQLNDLADLFDADGAALEEDGSIECHGNIPDDPSSLERIEPSLLTWDDLGKIGHCDRVPEDYPSSDKAAGVLVIRIKPGLTLSLFRKPVERTLRWGGNPEKPVKPGVDGEDRLQPRESFAEYLQILRRTCEPWSELDLQLAGEFRGLVNTFVVQRLESLAAELKRRVRVERELMASEMRTALAFEIPTLSFWEFDLVENEVSASHWYGQLGYNPDEMPPEYLRCMQLVHPEDRPRVIEAFDDFVEGERKTFNVEARVRHADGDWGWVESRARMVRDEDGAPLRVMGILYDIDDLKQYQQRLLTKNDELQSLVYAISHDLKSPLVTVKGFVGMLRDDLHEKDYEQAEHDLQRISAATQSMTEVIDDLLELSRLGRDGLRRTHLDLKRQVVDLRADFAAELRECDARLTLIEPCAPLIADTYAVKRVLTNLIDNAIRYACVEAGQTIEVGCELVEQPEPGAVLYVKDTGEGIDPQYHEKIFQVFERLARNKRGSGVGLASVAKAAELHGGRAWIESTRGKGSTFRVYLPYPLEAAPDPDDDVPRADPPPTRPKDRDG